ncbi:MAG TPA: hypothetical protein VKF83_04810 [Stellaceae bacterium]|nr:hypothetical protein [Stellaceae bacterium]
MQQVSEVFRSSNKVLAVREKLANNVLMLAKYMVLILPPPQEPCRGSVDWRKLPGISGELGAHLEQLALLDDEIRQLREKSESKTSQELRQAGEFAYDRYRLGVAVFDSIRRRIGDRHPDENKDWVRPFIHAMCAWEEANYRKKLNLPDILCQLDDFGELASLKYSTFLSFVTQGERYPNLAWEEAYARNARVV